jgi:glycosyltransferase involved in cell wall biosynthesis
MRINILSTKFDSHCGIGQYTFLLSSELNKMGYIIKCIFIDPKRKNPLYYLKKANDLTQNCDVIHIQFDYPIIGKVGSLTGIYIPIFYFYLKAFSLYKKYNIITTMHEIWNSKNPPKFGNLGSLYIHILNGIIKNCSNGIITLSETGKKELISEGFNPEKIYFVIFGTSPPIFLNKTEIKKRLGISQDKNIITIFGYIKKSKGHDILLEAAKLLDDSFLILVAGDIQSKDDSDYVKQLQNLADEKVIFMGFIKDEIIPEILNITNIMILPYREITQSGILNLAFSYGVPVISSDLQYFLDIQKECNCIVTFQKNNIQSLVSEIIRLSNNTDLMKFMGNSAKQYARNNTFVNAAEQHGEIYSKITKNSRL